MKNGYFLRSERMENCYTTAGICQFCILERKQLWTDNKRAKFYALYSRIFTVEILENIDSNIDLL